MSVHKVGLATVLAVVLAGAAFAQTTVSSRPGPATGIQRTLLQRMDLDGGREVILGLAEIPAGAMSGRHSHPGVETGYVLEGSAALDIDGEATRVMKAGDSYVIPAGKVHNARALGDKPAKVLATYVVEKGKPLSVGAPALTK